MIRSDRRIALAALCIGLTALVTVFLTGNRDNSAPAAAHSDSTGIHRIYRHTEQQRTTNRYYAVSTTPPETFAFDPNTADSTQLLRLGLPAWQVRNIYRYRAHGGIFRHKEDFALLYGLTVKEYQRLAPYISIGPEYKPASTLIADSLKPRRDTTHIRTKLQEGEQIVLNTADTTLLMRVPGIGPYYAKEIMRYGQRLGGYVSTNQLDEIDDFPPEAKTYFTISQPTPQKLNVNRLTLQQLRRHPYINFYQAKAITDYRRLHGPLRSLQDLRLSRDFPPEAIARLEPYVTF